MPKQRQILGVDLSPLLDAGGITEFAHACAPAPILTAFTDFT